MDKRLPKKQRDEKAKKLKSQEWNVGSWITTCSDCEQVVYDCDICGKDLNAQDLDKPLGFYCGDSADMKEGRTVNTEHICEECAEDYLTFEEDD